MRESSGTTEVRNMLPYCVSFYVISYNFSDIGPSRPTGASLIERRGALKYISGT